MPEGGRHSSDWIEELRISSIGSSGSGSGSGAGGFTGALTGVMLESAGCSPQGFASPGHSHGLSLVGHGNGSVGGRGHGAGAGMNGGGMVVDDAFDEDLSVLPRHTKVIVTGNNRTKSVLVGLHGVVKKAVGLGGWHWLVLTNGLKVKLQRNALSVLEPPTGLEEDENDSEDMFPSRPNVVDEFSKPYKSRVRPHKPTSGTANKTAHKGHTTDTSSTGSKTGGPMQGIANSGKRVNLSILETTSLLKYWRCYNLVETGPHPTREQLLDAVERHFRSQQLDEYQVIARFMQAAKRLKTVYG